MTSRRSMTGHAERLSRALQFVPGHVGGRVASAQPIRRRGGTLRSASVGATSALAFTGTMPTAASGYFGVDTADPFNTWPYTPDPGDMLVSMMYVSNYVTDSLPTITAPAGWRTLTSGTYGPGSSLHRHLFLVACIDSYAGTETRAWSTTGTLRSKQSICWGVAGASGMTWRAPELTATEVTPTYDSGTGEWTTTANIAWEAPDPTWLINCQAMLPVGSIGWGESPASPGNNITVGTVSPYLGTYDLTQSPQTGTMLHDGGATESMIAPYSPPYAVVLSLAFGAK